MLNTLKITPSSADAPIDERDPSPKRAASIVRHRSHVKEFSASRELKNVRVLPHEFLGTKMRRIPVSKEPDLQLSAIEVSQQEAANPGDPIGS